MAKITGLPPKAPQPTAKQKQQSQQLIQLENRLENSSEATLSSQSINRTSSGPTLPILDGADKEPTNGADRLRGNAQDNTIVGFKGDDWIYGNGGDDGINGGPGADILRGNSGDDEIEGDYGQSGNPDLINSGNDTLYGHSGDDRLFGQGKDDNIYAGLGDDLAEGGVGNDTIFGGNGDDLLYGDNEDLDPQDEDIIPELGGNDKLHGQSGNDKVVGGFGKDTVQGGSGDDTLYGGTGSDTLFANEGNDQLVGADTIFFGQKGLGFGQGEIDRFNGNKGNDIFFLGVNNALGVRGEDGTGVKLGDVLFYDDGNIDNIGDRDYGLILDFGFKGDSQKWGIDKVTLVGSEDDYSLGSFSNEDVSGTGIFLEEGQNTPELIGVLQNISLDSVNLGNSNQFIYE